MGSSLASTNAVQSMLTVIPALRAQLCRDLLAAPLLQKDYEIMQRVRDGSATDLERLVAYTNGLANYWGTRLANMHRGATCVRQPIAALATTKQPHPSAAAQSEKLTRVEQWQHLGLARQTQLFAPDFRDVDRGALIIDGLPRNALRESGLDWFRDFLTWEDPRATHTILWNGALTQADLGANRTQDQLQLRFPHLLWLAAALHAKASDVNWTLSFYHVENNPFSAGQFFASVSEFCIPIGIGFENGRSDPFLRYWKDLSRAARLIALPKAERQQWMIICHKFQELPDEVLDCPPVAKYLDVLTKFDATTLGSTVTQVKNDFFAALQTTDESVKTQLRTFYNFLTTNGHTLGPVTREFLSSIFTERNLAKIGIPIPRRSR